MDETSEPYYLYCRDCGFDWLHSPGQPEECPECHSKEIEPQQVF